LYRKVGRRSSNGRVTVHLLFGWREERKHQRVFVLTVDKDPIHGRWLMNSEPWIVKTRNGAIWGKIHRVIIDPASRQIVWVDVMLRDKNRFIRLPWRSLEIENEEIVLSTSEEELQTTVRSSGASLPDTVMLEESVPAFHI
jgi:hypothetical protein